MEGTSNPNGTAHPLIVDTVASKPIEVDRTLLRGSEIDPSFDEVSILPLENALVVSLSNCKVCEARKRKKLEDAKFVGRRKMIHVGNWRSTTARQVAMKKTTIDRFLSLLMNYKYVTFLFNLPLSANHGLLL